MDSNTIVVIDPQVAGISGDMLVAALVDAGANKELISKAIFECQNFLDKAVIKNVNFSTVVSHGFSATKLEMTYKDSKRERHAGDMFRSLSKLCDSLALENKAKAFALESFKTIAAAEAKIHGESMETVHLHEASSVDTFADIIGATVGLQDLGLFDATVLSTKVAVGGGLLRFSHGTTPNPGAAILEILRNRGFVFFGGQVDTELTTPTGSSLLVNAAKECISFYPEMTVEKIGYGSGQKSFDNFANVLRIVIGKSSSDLAKDKVTVIETNLDDVTGEVMGHLIERISAAGAKDVTVLQGITKKNRPSYLVRIISDQALVSSMLEILFAESGTLGARLSEVERVVLPRAEVILQVSIGDKVYGVNVKVVRDGRGRFKSAKAEHEDLKGISAQAGIPLKRVMELVNVEVMQKLGGLDSS
jgi:pyridinium-3,5-bisthiocarboxylic acid mononucleotide nickel chelatase